MLRRGRLRGLFLFDFDLFIQRAAEFIGGTFELRQAPTHGAAKLGSFRGPKMIRAMTKMIISSGIPIEPNIVALLALRPFRPVCRRAETATPQSNLT